MTAYVCLRIDKETNHIVGINREAFTDVDKALCYKEECDKQSDGVYQFVLREVSVDEKHINPYKEIFRLKEMLEKANIPFTFNELYKGYHLCYPKYSLDELVCSVVEHEGSYGNRLDLLEIMGLLTEQEREIDEVVGSLTAEEVFNRINNHWTSLKEETNV